MKIVNRLTFRHLKENKGRTVVTTLGICVSVAMITAVFVAVASVMNLFGEIELFTKGHQHAVFTVDKSQFEKLEEDDRIKNIGLHPDEKTLQFQLDDRATDRTGTGDIYIGDKVNLEQMFTGAYDGEIPQNENEIAVEQSLIEKNNLDWKIGDTVTVPTGYRYYIDNEDGKQVLILAGSYTGGEMFKCTEKKDYKITAILHDNPTTSDYCSIVQGFDLGKTPLADGEKAQAYIELKNVNYKSREIINEIVKEYNITKYSVNDRFLQTEFSFDKDGIFMHDLLPMIIIVLVIIIIASVMLIYNAFAMSLSERIRYLGMLASVGATKMQKKLSVYFEGAVLGAVGIPVGVLAGIAGIGVTLKLLGSKIIQTGMLNGVNDSNVQMKVIVPVWAIVGIIVFSAITIFISLYIPSGKASKITPIDAIRQRDEIKVKAKKLKSPKLIRKVFGYEGELAYKNLKRNGKKSKVITGSIALSVVLFLSCNYFCSMFSMSIDLESRVPYQIAASVNYEHKDDFKKELDSISEIDDYYSVLYFYEKLDEYKKENHPIVKTDYLTSTYKNLFNSKIQLYVNIIDDEDFNILCKSNSIDSSKYYGGSVKALLMNNINHKDNSSKVFNEKILGTEFTVDGAEGSSIEIADFVKYNSNFYACSLNPEKSVSLYIPVTQYYNVVQKDTENYDKIYFWGIETEQHVKVTEKIQSLMDENDYGRTYVSDFVENMQTMSTFTFVMQVFIYGFIALITLITTANIINTISTGIAMRKKEFAMLKSVGVTPKGFRKIIILESSFYAINALPVSLLLSIGISYCMNKGGGQSTIPFEINIPLYIGVILVVCVIIGATMLYAVSKLKDDSIVEALKEEIN